MSNENNVESPWKVPISRTAINSRNSLLEMLRTWDCNPEKDTISLSMGDPLSYGNLCTSQETTDAVIQTIHEGKHNGYAPSVGYEYSRQAVADYLSESGIKAESKDIILCSGCSSSLDLCITVLADGTKGQNILIPNPGFPLYKVLAESLGIEARTYDLLSDYNWEVDLYDLDSKIDEKTAAIIINNPSNPCGSVYSTNHLNEILEIADRRKIPIISDEIYEKLVFPENKFISVASLEASVPILICGGIGKSFLVPGWRLGWIVIYDPIAAFDQVRKGLNSLSQRIIGCNTVIQGALGSILHASSENYNNDLVKNLRDNAKIAFDGFEAIRGLKPTMPQGAIYMMVKINIEDFPVFSNTLEFVKTLYKEESVFCLPGEAFGITGFMRIVISTPVEIIKSATELISNFCQKYHK